MCMTDLMRDVIGPVYPRYGTLDYGPLFDNTKMAQYLQIVQEHSPRHQAPAAVEVVITDCMQRGMRVTERQRQALPDIARELVHLQWLIDAIPTALGFARTAFAATCQDPELAVKTCVFFLGLLDEVVSAFKDILIGSPVTMHLAQELRDNMQETYFPDHGPDPIIVVDRPEDETTAA